MFSRKRTALSIAPLGLDQVRSLPPLASGYETDRVFQLHRRQTGNGVEWRLEEERLPHPFSKAYDLGVRGEWLDSYADAGPPESLQFLGATRAGEVVGVATWTVIDWNASLWLVDIRVRAESRGSGVGTALVDALADRCRADELRGIFVETQIRNAPAIRFYRRRGFVVSGFNDHLYTNQDLAEQDVALFLFREA